MARPLPTLEFQRQDWMEQASCRYLSPTMIAWVREYRHGVIPTHAEWVNEFFGGRGGRPRKGDSHSSDYGDIRKLCAACPQQATCANLAVDREPRYGLFGGLVERERRIERKRKARATVEAAA